METLLSIEQAAQRLGGISKYTVEAWLSKGKLRRTKVGSRTMIRERDLDSFIAGCNPDEAQAPDSESPSSSGRGAK